MLDVPLVSADAEIARGAAAKFPVRSADLTPGLAGPALGAALKSLEARWVASDLKLSREEFLAAWQNEG